MIKIHIERGDEKGQKMNECGISCTPSSLPLFLYFSHIFKVKLTILI
jgi:hypothetical protein